MSYNYSYEVALEALFLEKQELVLERKKLIEATTELEKLKKEMEENIRKEMEENIRKEMEMKESAKKISEDDIKVSISDFKKSQKPLQHEGLCFMHTFNISWTIPVENFQLTQTRNDVYLLARNYQGVTTFSIYKYDGDVSRGSPNVVYDKKLCPFVDFLISHPYYLSPFLQQHPQKDLPKLLANKIKKELSDIYLKHPETKSLVRYLK
jgi:hypothetical protein